MDQNFWHQKWENNEINFHQNRVNPGLVKHLGQTPVKKGGRIFLPLCGKTLDISWLVEKGFAVVGVELVELAVKQLFLELGKVPSISVAGAFKRYHCEGLDILVGDIFKVTAELLGEIDLIYDRAALVALPQERRRVYAAHLAEVTKKAPQLLLTFTYDQTKREGPPFSITAHELEQNYGLKGYQLRLLEQVDIPGGLKNVCPAQESIWLLS